tara:strand:+ start:7886 stop:8185 length:300 start_codon:yes stop_codon:yes gene_type:complete
MINISNIKLKKKDKNKLDTKFSKEISKNTLNVSEKLRSSKEESMSFKTIESINNIQTLGFKNNSRRFIYVKDEDMVYLIIKFNNNYWKFSSEKLVQEVF